MFTGCGTDIHSEDDTRVLRSRHHGDLPTSLQTGDPAEHRGGDPTRERTGQQPGSYGCEYGLNVPELTSCTNLSSAQVGFRKTWKLRELYVRRTNQGLCMNSAKKALLVVIWVHWVVSYSRQQKAPWKLVSGRCYTVIVLRESNSLRSVLQLSKTMLSTHQGYQEAFAL